MNNTDFEFVKEKLRLMQSNCGREGCTWGDTEFDSMSVEYGYNLALQDLMEAIIKKEVADDEV